MSTTTRFIGNCQVCERDQKLHDGKMVHHGYKRPGHGSIEGDCPGVAEVPYEVSCELVKSYKLDVETRLGHQETYLADLKAGKITHLMKFVQRGAWSKAELVEYFLGVTEPHRWDRILESSIHDTEWNIHQCKSEIARCTRRIANWKLVPIRTVEEEKAKADTDKAARKAVRDAARAARQAKIDATKAKQDALKARREAIMDNFRNQIRALAESPESLDDRKDAARKLAHEMKKSKYQWMPIYQLGCNEEFVKLGLATESEVNGRKYFNYLYPLGR
jgi:hypothetical protein